MTDLSINLNKVALLRNSREGNYPNPVDFARLCIEAGCQGITVHPRPDQRHIRPYDVEQLGALCKAEPNIEFNIEGNPFAGESGSYPGFMALVESQRPDQVTLVPDGDDQLTSDHGFNLCIDGDRLRPMMAELKLMGPRVSLFMDPDPEQIRLAKEVGANRIELYTGPYAELYEQVLSGQDSTEFDQLHDQYLNASLTAREIGLGINAGHDLNLKNLPRFMQIPNILEVSIGHAFIADSLIMGMAACTKAYLDALKPAD